MMMNEKAIYTVKEAAAILCVTPRTVRHYFKDHRLRAIQRGQGYYLVHANDLRVFLGLEPDETLVAVSFHDGMVPPVSPPEKTILPKECQDRARARDHSRTRI